MSGVIGGNTYGGFGANNQKSNAKYGSIDNRTVGTTGNSSYGDGLGTYGDYNYNKSTLDKYKDTKTTTQTTTQKKT